MSQRISVPGLRCTSHLVPGTARTGEAYSSEGENPQLHVWNAQRFLWQRDRRGFLSRHLITGSELSKKGWVIRRGLNISNDAHCLVFSVGMLLVILYIFLYSDIPEVGSQILCPQVKISIHLLTLIHSIRKESYVLKRYDNYCV